MSRLLIARTCPVFALRLLSSGMTMVPPTPLHVGQTLNPKDLLSGPCAPLLQSGQGPFSSLPL